jgi:hypothetical protein
MTGACHFRFALLVAASLSGSGRCLFPLPQQEMAFVSRQREGGGAGLVPTATSRLAQRVLIRWQEGPRWP